MGRREALAKATEVVCALCLATCAAGAAQGLALSYSPGWHGNQWTAVWVCVVGALLAGQALSVYKQAGLAAGRCVLAWQLLAAWQACAAVALVVCLALVPSPTAGGVGNTGWWALAWLPPLLFIWLWARLHAAPLLPASVTAEVQQPGTASKPGAARRHTWRRARQRCLPSLVWIAAALSLLLASLLVLQAVWSALEAAVYRPDAFGRLVAVPIDSTPHSAQLFIRCTEPAARGGSSSAGSASGASTFLLEADAGAPAASLFGLQDALAAGGRRSCSYDRLGLGFSDDAILPGHLKRRPYTLHSLLAAAGERGPFVVAGQGLGGQLALQQASLYGEGVSGIALLDSASATAAHLAAGRLRNSTDAFGNERYAFRPPAWPARQLAGADALRALAPLGVDRFVQLARLGVGRASPYAGLVAALAGTSKAAQGRWADERTAHGALPDSLDEQLTMAAPDSGQAFWLGTGWLDASPRPVLVLAAADSVADAGCGLSEPGCQAAALAAPGAFLAKQALAYAATLSSNASLAVLPGGHSRVQSDPGSVAALLLARFAGV